MGMAMAEPPALLQALADRARAGKVEALKLYYFEATSIAGDTVLDYDLVDRIEPYCMFMTKADRDTVKQGLENDRKVLRYVPNTFHQAPRLLSEEIGIETFVCAVSPMDEHGYMTFGVGNDYSSKVGRSAKRLIVEVNRHMPRVLGSGAQLHVSEVAAIVEHDAPLLELPVRGGGDGGRGDQQDDRRHGAGWRLPADGRRRAAEPGVRRAEGQRSDLGIHTEALCPGLVDLTLAGNVTNLRKALNTGKTVYTFAMGQKAMYDFLDDNPSVESWPVDYVTDPGVIAQNDRWSPSTAPSRST